MEILSSPDTVSLPRKERERLARRMAILQAAEEVIAEKGYAKATLDEIALRAEFGKGTLYNYFPDGKTEILFAIFEQLFDRMVAVVDQSFTGSASFRRELETFLDNVFAFFSMRSDLFVILMREVQRAALMEDKETQEFFHAHGSRTVVALAAHVQAAMERGEVDAAQLSAGPHVLAHHIIHTAKGFYMSQKCAFMTDGAPVDLQVLARQVTALLTDGFSSPSHS
ncbi:MAG: TetR/AcrR family transcriptional regulator [Rhodothermales bacterium]